MSGEHFGEKACSAIARNFAPAGLKPEQIKKHATELLSRLNLETLGTSVGKDKGVFFRPFFTAKTHKPDMPFRVIVTERGTWQYQVSGYLQKHLSSLSLNDPFLISGSNEIVEFLNSEKPSQCTAFSVDAVDLFYSIPHSILLTYVKACITNQSDEFAFINRSGIIVESVIELLGFYLSSTLVGWDDKVFPQRLGICIVSRVALVLSEIFLSSVDRVLTADLGEMVLIVFRYVDDYMLLFRKNDYCVI